MSGIDRRGQKVVCVCDVEIEMVNQRLYGGPTPREGRTYTVEDFIDNKGLIVAPDGRDVEAGIAVTEVRTIRGRIPSTGEQIVIGWPICCFRPLDERATDISDLVRLGDRSPAREAEDA